MKRFLTSSERKRYLTATPRRLEQYVPTNISITYQSTQNNVLEDLVFEISEYTNSYTLIGMGTSCWLFPLI
jgi:hypothetical protein